MRTIRCWRLRSMLTPYVDDELTAGERLDVDSHLERCDRCRNRVSRQRTIAQRLRGSAAEMRAGDVALSVMMTADAPRRTRGAKRVTAVAAAVAIVLVAVAWNRWPPRAGAAFAARGLITDSRCAGGHTPASGTISRGDCVRRCVEMGAHYVFVAQGVTYAISNQDFAGLTGMAGEEVQLEGSVERHVLTVSQVRPAAGGQSRTDVTSTRATVS